MLARVSKDTATTLANIVNLHGRGFYQFEDCLKPQGRPMMWVKRWPKSQAVNLFYGLYTGNLSAHHAPLREDETTSHLGVNDHVLWYFPQRPPGRLRLRCCGRVVRVCPARMNAAGLEAGG
ncbi:protein of unknown function [Pseudomonas sp. JV241A]|nr:protein of unknown function [Pseudomonas sp. JV241A]